MAEKQAVASAIEEQRLIAEAEEKEFKKSIQQYPYELRVEAAVHAYRSADNKFTQAQLADRHVIGITSFKNKLASGKKNDAKARQDAIISGVAAAEFIFRGSVLDVEATNEAHLEYISTRAQAAKEVHEKKKIVDELKAQRTSARAEKRKVLFVFDSYFLSCPRFSFYLQRKEADMALKTAERELKTSRTQLNSYDSAFFTTTFGGVANSALVGRPAEFEERTVQAVVEHFNRIQTNIKNGVSQAALVQMLLKTRQRIQSPSGKPLNPPSKSCLIAAVRRCDTETCMAKNAPDSRGRALEDWRNVFSHMGMMGAISRLNIDPELLFNIDDVGKYLGVRGNGDRGTLAHFRPGMIDAAVARRLSPGIAATTHQPRMVYFSCMTSASGDLPATVVTVKDRQIPQGIVELKQLVFGARELWVCFCNPDQDKQLLSKRILKQVFLPRIREAQKVSFYFVYSFNN